MKKLTKLALAIGIAAVSASALSQVTLVDGQGETLVTYDYSKMEVEGGEITITGASYLGGSLPGFEPGDLTCGTGTTQSGNTCVVNFSAVCGVNTVRQGDQCVGEAPDLTPPTLGITSSPTSMGDGVSTSTLTFQFSRPVVNFTASDVNISPSGHSISNFSQVNDSRWTATLNRSGNTSGTITVSVSAGSYEGTNGVSGGAASRSITLTGEPTNIGDCTIPSNVRLSTTQAVTRFGHDGSSIEFKVQRSPIILSHPFTTTADPNVSGNVDMGGMSHTSDHVKRMWISECAGGPAIHSRCDQSGIAATLKWAQRNVRATCELDTNTTYFFNIAYPAGATFCNATAGCDAIIHHKGGW